MAILLGLVQGKIPSMSATMPSTVEVSYEDGDQSRPVITGQPAVEMDAKNISVSGESMLIDDLTLDTTMPPEMLLAELQKSEAAGGAEDGEQAQNSEDDNPFSGDLDNLISITDVAMNTGENTLDFEISGGLATLSMVPEVTDGTLSMSLSDVKIFGMSLPQSVAESLSDQLESTVNEASEELTIQSAEVTEDGLKIRLHGTQINMDEIDTSGAFGTESGSGADSGANSEDQAA